MKSIGTMSPSLRGSGLKWNTVQPLQIISKSPSLRGSGLKFDDVSDSLEDVSVSLFTREWIEMLIHIDFHCIVLRLPLYEGVD